MNKKNNGFKKLLLLMGLAALFGCTKPEDPNQNNQIQDDSIPTTPVTPVKTHDTIYLNWDTAPSFGPHEDTIRNRLNRNPKLRELVIKIHGNDGINNPVDCTNKWSFGWTLARDELSQDMALDSLGRIVIRGDFIIINANATDPLACEPGITPENKAWFENNGCKFLLPRAITNGGKSSPLPRAITNGGKRR